jgi:hypothetical protein
MEFHGLTRYFMQLTTCYSQTSHIHHNETKQYRSTEQTRGWCPQHTHRKYQFTKLSFSSQSVLYCLYAMDVLYRSECTAVLLHFVLIVHAQLSAVEDRSKIFFEISQIQQQFHSAFSHLVHVFCVFFIWIKTASSNTFLLFVNCFPMWH